MDTATLVVATSATTACFVGLLFIAFFFLRPPKQEAKTKKLKQCPTCKRWQEVS